MSIKIEGLKPDRINLIKVENPFRPDRSYIAIDFNGQSLLDLRNTHFPEDIDVAVSVNGELIPKWELEKRIPQQGECIVMAPRVHGGGGGKDIFRTIAFIAVMIASIASGQWYLTSVAGATLFGASMVMMGVSIIGGLLINALLPPPAPDTNSSDYSTSQTYSWSPQTIQAQGGVIPVIYGVNKCFGNVITAYLENSNNDTSNQYLNLIVALGMGPLESIYDIYLNDQPIENLNANGETVTPYIRLGLLDQPPVPIFDNNNPVYSVSGSTKIDTTTTSGGFPGLIITTDSAYPDFDGIEVDVTFPSGLFYANDSGGLDNYSYTFSIEARKLNGDGIWHPMVQTLVSRTAVAGGRWSAGYWPTFENYAVGVIFANAYTNTGWKEVYTDNSTDPNAHSNGDIYGHEGAYQVIWRWIPEAQFETVTVSTDPDNQVTVTSNKNSAIRRTYKYAVNPADKGSRHEIRIRSYTAETSSSRYGDDFYYAGYRLMNYENYSYPRIALVGLRALATNQLSGSLRFSCMTTGKYCRVYNDGVWTIEATQNPAWVVYDILTQPLFDDARTTVIRYEGFDPSCLVLDDFVAWAAFCDTSIKM